MLRRLLLTASAVSALAAGSSPALGQEASGPNEGSVAKTAQDSSLPAASDEGARDAGDVAPQTSDGIGEIVITAQRRAETMQRVPISVSAIDAATLTASGISGVQDIKMAVPSTDVVSTNGYASPFIRGLGSRAVGPGIESPVATYVDGVYIAASASALLSFNNIQRVEVLKGPQGTLFGRNATGGLIQIITRDPEHQLSGELNVGYGSFDTWSGDLYLTGGLGEGVAADIAAYVTAQGEGYGSNFFNGGDAYRTHHDFGVRSKWLLEPSDTIQIRVAGDYSDLKTSAAAQRPTPGATLPPPYGLPFAGTPWDINASVQPLIRAKQGGASVRVDADFGSVAAVSTTAYRKSRYINEFDLDLSPVEGRSVLVDQFDDQFSQEIQLLSQPGSPLTWIAGAFYWKASGEYDPTFVSLNGVSRPHNGLATIYTESRQDVESIAPYVQGTYEILPDVRLTLGARYTWESREVTGETVNLTGSGAILGSPVTLNDAVDTEKFTWRVSLDYQVTPDTMIYISQNRGFKSGGYSISNLAQPSFLPETLDAYEVGVKSILFDRRLRFNSAIFYYDYSDVQTLGLTTGQLFIINGGKARIKGAEFDFELRPLSGLVLNGGYTYLDSEWREFAGAVINIPNPAGGKRTVPGDVVGNRLPNAPKHAVTLGGTYTVPVGVNRLSINGSFYHSSGYFGEPDNVSRQGAYSLVNASIRYSMHGDRLVFSIWGRNLTDEAVNVYPTHLSVGGGLAVERASYAPPRTYGVTAGVRF